MLPFVGDLLGVAGSFLFELRGQGVEELAVVSGLGCFGQ